MYGKPQGGHERCADEIALAWVLIDAKVAAHSGGYADWTHAWPWRDRNATRELVDAKR
jgi:hypothetical protein